jgi:tetratricopeptide (TPR) repeat protein
MKKVISMIGLFFFLALAVSGQTTAKEWNKQGIEQFKKLEYKQAFESFTKAIALDPTFGEAYYNRANAWYQLPSDAFPDHDGCTDLKKAKELGFKGADKKIKELGCS